MLKVFRSSGNSFWKNKKTFSWAPNSRTICFVFVSSFLSVPLKRSFFIHKQERKNLWEFHPVFCWAALVLVEIFWVAFYGWEIKKETSETECVGSIGREWWWSRVGKRTVKTIELFLSWVRQQHVDIILISSWRCNLDLLVCWVVYSKTCFFTYTLIIRWNSANDYKMLVVFEIFPQFLNRFLSSK